MAAVGVAPSLQTAGLVGAEGVEGDEVLLSGLQLEVTLVEQVVHLVALLVEAIAGQVLGLASVCGKQLVETVVERVVVVAGVAVVITYVEGHGTVEVAAVAVVVVMLVAVDALSGDGFVSL